jgi:hypothetical protein
MPGRTHPPPTPPRSTHGSSCPAATSSTSTGPPPVRTNGLVVGELVSSAGTVRLRLDDVVPITASLPFDCPHPDPADKTVAVCDPQAFGSLRSRHDELFVHLGDGNNVLRSVSSSVAMTADGVGATHNDLDGGAGADDLTGAAGNDILRGGSGIDVLRRFGGHDELAGGVGRDVLPGGDGNDRMVGNGGPDRFHGASAATSSATASAPTR